MVQGRSRNLTGIVDLWTLCSYEDGKVKFLKTKFSGKLGRNSLNGR